MALAKETGLPRPRCKAALAENGNDYEAARVALLPAGEATAYDEGLEPAPPHVVVNGRAVAVEPVACLPPLLPDDKG